MAITTKSQLKAEIQTLYKSQGAGAKEMPLLLHAKELNKINAKSKADPKRRQDIRNTLGKFVSDFFERAQFRPLTASQKNQFYKPESAPDGIAYVEEIGAYEDLPEGATSRLIPKLATKQFIEGGEQATMEIKQVLGEGTAATTAFQLQAEQDIGTFSSTFDLSDKEKGLMTPGKGSAEGISLKGKRGTEGHALRKKITTEFSGAKFTTWMFSGTGGANNYLADVKKIFNEKISNYELINWKDKEHMGKGRFPTFTVVPGASKTLNINTRPNFEKFVTVSPNKDKTTVDADGTVSMVVQFKLSSSAEAVLEKHAVDITKKVHEKFAKTGSIQLMNYMAANLDLAQKRDIDFLIEILRFAKEFDPRLMDTPYVIQTGIQSAKSGMLTKGVKYRSKKTGKAARRKTIQATISSAQLTTSIQRSLYARMPKGSLRGEPLSDEILTNRSGRFVKSVIAQVKGSLIRYFYNPIYQVHESTGRNPSETIEESIRNITQRQVGRQFNIVKGI